jgi:hypothetical protein
MSRLTEWISRRRQSQRSGKRSHGNARASRRLAFERYEERLALSTTTAVEPSIADRVSEGGFIAFEPGDFDSDTTTALYGGPSSADGQTPTHFLSLYNNPRTAVAGLKPMHDIVNIGLGSAIMFDADFFTEIRSDLWHLVNSNGIVGGGVRVAVIDSGFATATHPDLWNNLNGGSPSLVVSLRTALSFDIVNHSGGIADFGGAGLSVTDSLFVDVDSSPVEFNSETLADAANASPRVVPIPPPIAGGEDPSGGHIPMLAFTGVTGLSLARPDELGVLAKGRQPVYDPVVDERVQPSHASPVESLRGRAVVYEVADVEREVSPRGEGEPAAELSFAETGRGGWTVTYASARASAADPNIKSASHASARHQASVAATAYGETVAIMFGEPGKLASSGASGDSVSVPAHVAAERDAAFEKWADESDSVDGADAPVAATGETRQRTALGVALMLALGVRPMNRLFRSRRAAAAAEQRPRQRGWDGSHSVKPLKIFSRA